MTILALEFSSAQRSVAVLGGPKALGRSAEVIETGGHGGAMIGLIEAALRQAHVEREQIECLAVGLGPGSYTGIRSAIALAQGWELASAGRAIRCIGLSSADCIALQAQSEGLAGPLSVVIDAQRNEFYLAGYQIELDGPRAIQPLRLASLAEVQARQAAGELLAGPDATKWFPAAHLIFPRAAALAQMVAGRAEFVSTRNLQPIYLRETRFVKAPPPRKLPSL
jgi:tRNA threonylcarbamoyl adenosine modification protein YeaZ